MNDTNNAEKEVLILKAVLTVDKKIRLDTHSNHTGSLALISKMLDLEIGKLLLDERIKQSGSRKIIPSSSGGGIINFIRKGMPHAG